MLSVLACTAVICWMVWKTWARLQLRSRQLVRREAWGPLRIELRRRAEMCCHADGQGGQSFPQPIETRQLTVMFCELPLWTRTESIGLPCGAEAHLGQLATADYDHHFTVDFRAAARPRPAMRFHLPA